MLFVDRRPTPLAILLTLLLIVGGLWVAYANVPASTASPASPPPTTGTLTGRLATTDGGLASDMVVCAQSTTDGARTCAAPGAVEHYELTVKPGQYLVLSYRAIDPDTQAFYTDRVTCIADSACTGQGVVVTVQAGQRLTDINPIDWETN